MYLGIPVLARYTHFSVFRKIFLEKAVVALIK